MTEPVDLLKLNDEEFKKFIDSFDHVFSDCDGVIWSGKPLPGSEQFFKAIKKLGKTVHFVSNNSLRSKENYTRLFNSVDIENGYENLTIPSFAIVEYLKSLNFTKQVYCVTCPETIRVLEANGFRCKDGPDIGADNYADYVKYLEEDSDIGAVALDSDFKVNIPKIYRAMTYLKDPEVLFINGATDRYVPFKPGCIGLGVGPFTDIIAEEAKREPVQLAKPGRMFGELAMKRAGVADASRVLFIGDMIEQDVGLGKATGFKTLLVLTNTTREVMSTHKTLKPDFYADSLGSIVPILTEFLKD